jgi:hypothetical protein
VVVGGFAIIQAGYARFTDDLDLLVDASPENERRVFEALRCLPDKAVDQLEPGDVDKFIVVRVGDEILVDLIKCGCGVDYDEAIKDAQFSEIGHRKAPQGRRTPKPGGGAAAHGERGSVLECSPSAVPLRRTGGRPVPLSESLDGLLSARLTAGGDGRIGRCP